MSENRQSCKNTHSLLVFVLTFLNSSVLTAAVVGSLAYN